MMDKNMTRMINNLKNNIDKLFENNIFNTMFVIIVTIFAAHFVPRLPKNILYLFNNNIFKIIFISFIVYIATKNMKIAIVSSIALVIIIQSLNFIETRNKIIKKIKESTQIVSDNRIKVINKMIENPIIEKRQKISLVDNVMKSIASDKHKFNTAISFINSLPAPSPATQFKIIKKLYSDDTNIKKENIINMSKRLLLNEKICKKNIGKITKLMLKSKIHSSDKKNIIIDIIKKIINPKIKILIMKKMKKSNISNHHKNKIIKNIKNINSKINKKTDNYIKQNINQDVINQDVINEYVINKDTKCQDVKYQYDINEDTKSQDDINGFENKNYAEC